VKSPPNAAGGSANAAHRKLLSTQSVVALSLQINGVGLFAWPNEACRLLDQYWETGHPKHLNAFSRHITAMRDYWEGLAR